MKFKINAADLINIYIKNNKYMNFLSECNHTERMAAYIDAIRKLTEDNLDMPVNVINQMSVLSPESFISDYLPVYSEEKIYNSNLLYTGWLPQIAGIIIDDDNDKNNISVLFSNNICISEQKDDSHLFGIPSGSLSPEDRFCRLIASVALGDSFKDIINLIKNKSDEKAFPEKSEPVYAKSEYSENFFRLLADRYDSLTDTFYSEYHEDKTKQQSMLEKCREDILNALVKDYNYNLDDINHHIKHEISSDFPAALLPIDKKLNNIGCFKVLRKVLHKETSRQLFMLINGLNACLCVSCKDNPSNPEICLRVSENRNMSMTEPIIKISASLNDIKHRNYDKLSVDCLSCVALADFLLCSVCSLSLNALRCTVLPCFRSVDSIKYKPYTLITKLFEQYAGIDINKTSTAKPLLMEILDAYISAAY